jgi:hypothetical protein
LDVGEAELICDFGNGLTQLVWKLDILVVGKLPLPEMAV